MANPSANKVVQDPNLIKQNKEAAKQALLLADRHVKEGDFLRAKTEVEKAQKLDPSNPYVTAFLDRIAYFEALKKKEAAAPQAAPAQKAPEPAAAPAPAQAPAAGSKPATAPTIPFAPNTPPPAPPKPVPTITSVPLPPPVKPPSADKAPTDARIDSKLEEMRQQIDMLTKALQQEKLAREEINSRQLQSAVSQFRAGLEKAWVNGAPKEQEEQQLHQLALSLALPEEVESSVRREVKIDMYSRAVKEVVAKRKLLKSSSSTFEWLRKVYQISVTEYLENESKFLLDLVADQYKGTVLLISEAATGKDPLTIKLKTAGYATVIAPNPETALEKIEKINPNVILCETTYKQSVLGGLKFLHVVRANSKLNATPFILICDSKEVESLQSSELRPNEGFVKKPVDFDELSSLMNEHLARFREYISTML
ncbi:MAG: response regulator [Bacteroidota bacterium]